jgi:hypothetical protein
MSLKYTTDFNGRVKFQQLHWVNKNFVLFRRGGASRVVNKAYRVSEAIAGVGEKPTPYCTQLV